MVPVSPLQPARDLVAAVEANDLATVKAMLESGVSANVKDDFGRAAIHYAAKHDFLAIAELLAASGADLSIGDVSNCQATLEAAENGSPAVLRFLLDAGLDIEEKTRHRQTLLMQAAAGEETPARAECVKLLLERGASLEAKSFFGQTARDVAVKKSRTSIVRQIDAFVTLKAQRARAAERQRGLHERRPAPKLPRRGGLP